ncbi:MAG: FHA domain-containing protein [Anaerolineales bacterium]|nr:FHA domain-containing protein [Anaerolineales bacterium]
MERIRLPAVFALIAIPLCLTPCSASAAEGDTAYLFGLDNAQFPQISAFLSATDGLGFRREGLTAEQVTLWEDDSPARNLGLKEVQTGMRLVVVLDPGLDLLYKLPDGEARIDRLRRAMADWLGTLGQQGIDDLTLVTPQGIAVSHASDPETFLAGLRAYAPKIPAERTLDALLVDALGAAADPLPYPGMRALMIVFSASRLSQAEDIGKGLCPRARELHAPLYGIWSGRVEPSAQADMDALAGLAEECGGYSVALESSTGTATMLGAVASQRIQYRLEYRSSASDSGEHTLAAAVAQEDFQAETEPLRFSLAVQPPAVEWIDFPERISRKGSEVSTHVDAYLPGAVDLRVEVVFPDGHPREIVAMQLFADGELIEGECLGNPCRGIRLDLRRYPSTATIRLQMVVRDELGLEGKSEERKLWLAVERPALWDVFRQQYLVPAAVILGAAAAAGILTATLVNLNRIRAVRAADGLIFPNAAPAAVVPGSDLASRFGIRRRRKRFPAESPAETYAVLEELGESGRRYELTAEDVIVGRDPRAAGIVLNDPSVSPRHGRIVRMGDGSPWIFDLGSAAGCWKNFEEVPPEGASLRQGDRLNFGRAAFRVRLKPLPAGKEILHEA